MIIPVRCFTCNNVIGSKYIEFLNIISSKKQEDIILDSSTKLDSLKETVESSAFKQLNIKRVCCKRHLLTHVDLIDKI